MRIILGLALALCIHANGETSQFQDCFDHGDGGAAPPNAPTFYQIVRYQDSFPFLIPVGRVPIAPDHIFKLIIEDVRFTTYKCWDQSGALSGFDIEMMSQAAYESGYQFIEFILRPWTDVIYNGKKRLSLLVDLNRGLGDAVSAGMSITTERQEIVDMVGPIYKAGKKLMARKDNSKINSLKLEQMLLVPQMGYEPLKGLTVMVSNADIRSAFFRKLAVQYPDLVEYLTLNSSGEKLNPVHDEESKLLVFEVSEFSQINDFIDNHMSSVLYGRLFDLVMIDTGSSKSLIDEGKLGVDTQIVTGNLAADPNLGDVFGLGDGVSFRKDDSVKMNLFRQTLAAMIRSGRINSLVDRWFQDENAADHSWARELAP